MVKNNTDNDAMSEVVTLERESGIDVQAESVYPSEPSIFIVSAHLYNVLTDSITEWKLHVYEGFKRITAFKYNSSV